MAAVEMAFTVDRSPPVTRSGHSRCETPPMQEAARMSCSRGSSASGSPTAASREAIVGAGPVRPAPATGADVDAYLAAWNELTEALTH